MSGNAISIASEDGRVFNGYLAIPRPGSGPGIVLFDADSAEAERHRCADLYAAEGYVALSAPTLASGSDAAAVVASLRDRSECTGKVAALGFGRGAATALLVCGEAPIECAVCFYPAQIEAVLDQVRQIGCAIMLHLAGNDPSASASSIALLRQSFAGSSAEAGIQNGGVSPNAPSTRTIYTYPGAAPGFAHRGNPGFDRAAAGLSHSRTVALLRRQMGPHYDLEALWEAHIRYEFATREVDKTMATMVDEPYVNHVPVMTGGVGQRDLARFYANHFIPKCPADTVMVPISRTVGADRVVDEMVVSFTHDVEIDWMLPGVAPTGRRVEVPLVAIVGFRGDKLYHEHIYWDQASVLVQIGLLDPGGLPVAGAETARKLLDETRPSNTLMKRWAESAPAVE
jgi:carboxymethylenebutenolidase